MPFILYFYNPDIACNLLVAGDVAFAIELPLYKLLKNSVKRHRPREALSEIGWRISPSDKFSFPSGHTAAAFFTATLLTYFLPILALLVLIWYLPFEQLDDIKSFLQPFKRHHFHIYHRLQQVKDQGNIHLRPYSRSCFLNDLAECNGVIAKARFELTSEALHLGKKILVKPLAGQMEQLSNALVISQLNLGMVMDRLNPDAVAQWLDGPPVFPIHYPNVARIIAQWIENGHWDDIEGLALTSWAQVQPQP